jgi:guanosine-3',5'-bis(diphosphate) 3'-pyrophosphohydrolase
MKEGDENDHTAAYDKRIIIKEYKGLLKSFNNTLSKSDKKNIRLAFEIAADAHKDMRRKSGEPYIIHPLQVAQIVSGEIGLGPTAVICALLHDVVEDTETSLEDIKREFGSQISAIVDGLTKIKGGFDITSSSQAENFRKILLTMAEDIRVILIKIADRLHNMRTLDSMSRQNQLKIASETIYLYAPLAHRLGLYNIKSELEDLSLKYIEPDIYRTLAKKLAVSKAKRTKYINEFIKPIKEHLENSGFNFQISGRPKSISSIWNKMKKKGVEFEEVYDLFAIRVVLDVSLELEKTECWKVYSILTDKYTPSPDRLRDWISTPKGTGYEALHTTVMGNEGKWVEVQIRSKRMDDMAEKGFAAHWKYKEEKSTETHLDEWLRQIRELLNQKETSALDFINDFKMNLFSEEIYIFTPKGETKLMPAKSTALDFAFEIHSQIGSKCIGAKVNHKLVPLSHELKNGDQVEIITSNKQKPNEDWLNFVVTAKAKAKIKDSFKEEKRKKMEEGKLLLNKKMHALKISLNNENTTELLKHFKQVNIQELYFLLANKPILVNDIENIKYNAGKLEASKPKEIKPTTFNFEEDVKKTLQKNAELIIFGESSDRIAYSLARCCTPIPGDDVFGYVTATDGLKIHNTKCPNAVNLMSKHAHRIVKTKWSKQHEIAFLTGLAIKGIDDVGIMNKITHVISGLLKINMRSITIDTEDGIFMGKLMLYVNDSSQLLTLIEELKKVDGIQTVERFEGT